MKQAKLEDATMLKCNNAEMQHQDINMQCQN